MYCGGRVWLVIDHKENGVVAITSTEKDAWLVAVTYLYTARTHEYITNAKEKLGLSFMPPIEWVKENELQIDDNFWSKVELEIYEAPNFGKFLYQHPYVRQ